MESISWLIIITYVFFGLILTLFIVKALRYAKLSIHLRWELYPLAGDKNRPWGGSYLEEPEWWTNPPEGKSFLGEMKFMVREILFFRDYFRLNRDYWYFVYPFHIGIFIFILFLLMLFVGAATMMSSISVSIESVNTWSRFVYYTTLIMGSAGLILGAIGCVGLLLVRRFNKNLRPYTKRKEYLNLLFVLAVIITGIFSWILIDQDFSTAREYVQGLITFSPMGNIEPLLVTHIILLLLLAAYMPFTNMLHFFAKWFTYHKVRWDDAPNLRGSNLEKSLESIFSQPLSWSAPHIQSIMHWSDIAEASTENKHTPRVQKG